MLGTIQAVEAMKSVTGTGTLLTNAMLTFDALSMDFRKIKVRRNPLCPICGEHPSITVLADEEQPVCDLKSLDAKR
jgi:molybdopterin/thiamine biosynthesis adenylyltransferase